MRILAAAATLAALAACTGGNATSPATSDTAAARQIGLTIRSANGAHAFRVDTAKTEEEQQRGLMFRTNIPKDGGMLFYPYPPAGGGPREATFWMKNTPSSLDLIFIRADHTIAHIAENAVPFSEAPIPSGEPVAAVLEINGGRAAELGLAEGDKVDWGK